MTTMNLLAESADAPVTLEPGGIVVMTLSILLVTGLTIFCVTHILREKSPSTHHHAPLDIDTHDAET